MSKYLKICDKYGSVPFLATEFVAAASIPVFPIFGTSVFIGLLATIYSEGKVCEYLARKKVRGACGSAIVQGFQFATVLTSAVAGAGMQFAVTTKHLRNDEPPRTSRIEKFEPTVPELRAYSRHSYNLNSSPR